MAAFLRRKAGIFMKQSTFFRVLFYIIGLLVLALGLTLNTKTGLGVSPIISVAYSTAVISGHNFGNMTLALYSLFVVIELILHLIREHRYVEESHGALSQAGKRDRKLIFLMDILQIPLSLTFAGHLIGIGVGTIIAMIGVGRTIAVFNHFTYDKMKQLAGIEN